MTALLRPMRLGVAALLLLLAPLSVLLYRLRYDGRLPDPMPTHWGASGQVDGTTALATFTTVSLVVSALVALVGVGMLGLLRRRPVAAAGVVASAWVSWMAATTYAAAVAAAAGAATAGEVPLQGSLVVAILLVPTLVATVTWLLVPLSPRERGEAPVPTSRLTLEQGERVTWVGQSSSPWLLVLAAAMVVASVALVFVLWPLAIALGAVSLALAWAHRIMVRVDDSALTVAWGPARWPRVRVPMTDVAAARAASIEPLAWGGWGYRVTPRGHAAVTRRGPGLVLSRRRHSAFAVTVDQPEAAADLINAVVRRSAAGPPA